MSEEKTLTFAIMDPPFENARSTTVLRLMHVAASRGYDINVFAYEGAVGLPFTKQSGHANAVHGHDADEEDHPLPHKWVAALILEAQKNGGKIDWVNCGLCVDERGVAEAVQGVRRGTPGDLWKMASASDNTLVIPTK